VNGGRVKNIGYKEWEEGGEEYRYVDGIDIDALSDIVRYQW
jgi:hypothetical protein